MYFKDFPSFLYDFNYGNGNVRTTIVKDVTRNIRFKKEILANITVFDEYDIIDGETPEIISEKFYGTPEYHWVVMLANEKYDWTADFPLQENILQKHIETTYNPVLYSTDWKWTTDIDKNTTVYIRVTEGSTVPFEAAYLTAPTKITLSDPSGKYQKIINFPYDTIGLDEDTQYFYFPWNNSEFAVTEQYDNIPAIGGNGTGATFNVSRRGVSYTITLNDPGLDYKIGDVLTINGSSINGTEINNITVTVAGINTGNTSKGAITKFSYSGIGDIRVTIKTLGRENNPVLFADVNGTTVDPTVNPFSIPVTGSELYRAKNDAKRRIRIISPKLLELVLKNYEELL